MNIFKLVGSVFVDTAAAENSLQKTDSKASKVGETLLGAAGKAGKFAAGLATAAAGAVTGMVALASKTAEAADVVDKASQRMGISTDSYQELSHAAGLCGVSMSTMETAAKKLVGTDISFDDAMESIYALETAEERAAMAAELFGEKVAYEMAPMLNASGEEMAAMKQEAHDLGAVMSEDMVKDGATLNDTISKIKEAFTGIIGQIGGALIPIINKAGEYIITLMPTFNAIIADILPVLVNMLDELLPVFIELVEQLLPPILQLVKALLPPFVELCKIILPILSAVLTGIVTLIVDYVIPAITGLINGVKNMADKMKEPIEKVKNFFVNAWEAISTKTSAIFNGIKETIKNVMNGLITIVKTPVNAIIGMINKMIQAMNALSFDVPSWVPVIGGKKFGFDLKEIPLLAKGGDVKGSGSAIVGEAGAELIDLPAGARVTPLTGDNGLKQDEILASLADVLAQMQVMQQELVNALKTDLRAYIPQNDIYEAVVDADREHYEQTRRPSFAG